ncbi:hypothetical protein L6V77_26665 [Myxococcota bacterium]|nr:hypothetical protein [Myxococcota bacterium]
MSRRHRPSGYMWRPKVNDTEIDEAATRAAHHLHQTWVTAGMPTSTAAVGGTAAPFSQVFEPIILTALEHEATRFPVSRKDRPALVSDAVQYVHWARQATIVRSARVLARFAVSAAYDATRQYVLTQILADDYPRSWRSSPLGKEPRRLFPGSSVGSTRVALTPKMLAPLTASTSGFTVDTTSPVNIHEPYHGLRPTWGWSCDPIRPPLSAIRYAASLTRKFKGPGNLRVLLVEGGLTAAVSGLALFLGGKVHTFSPVRGDTTPPVTDADVAVVNLANGRSMALVEAAVARAGAMKPALLRDEIDLFWGVSPTAPGDHVAPLVDVALRHLGANGLLVLVGDVESGAHRQGVDLISKSPDLHNIRLTPNGRPMQFGYSSPPWAPFGGLPATDRFVSAWMRVQP